MKRCGYTIVVHQHRGFNYGWSWVVVGSASKVMAGCGWSWGVGVKLWLALGGGNEIMTGRGWSLVVAVKLWLIVDGRGWIQDLVVLIVNHIISFCAHFLEYFKLVLDDNVDQGSE